VRKGDDLTTFIVPKVEKIRSLNLPLKMLQNLHILVCTPERKLRLFENRVLRRVFGPGRDEITGEWRRLHAKELMISTSHQILLV
jgi:hypothetical protein